MASTIDNMIELDSDPMWVGLSSTSVQEEDELDTANHPLPHGDKIVLSRGKITFNRTLLTTMERFWTLPSDTTRNRSTDLVRLCTHVFDPTDLRYHVDSLSQLIGQILTPPQMQETVSPFDQLQSNEDAKNLRLLCDLAELNSLSWSKDAAERITRLLQLAYEDEPEQTPLRPTSLALFLRLVQELPSLPKPKLALSRNRNLEMELGKTDEGQLVVEFLPLGWIEYGIIGPRPVSGGSREIGSGRHPYQRFKRMLLESGWLRWFSQGQNDQ